MLFGGYSTIMSSDLLVFGFAASFVGVVLFFWLAITVVDSRHNIG